MENKLRSFEASIVKPVLVACAVPSLLLFYFLSVSAISIYLKILIVILVVTTVSYICFFVYAKISHQLRTSTNLLEAIVVGDNTMRANTQLNSGAMSDFNRVLNGITATMEQQKQSIKEQQLLFAKVVAQIDVAIIAADAQGKIVLINPSAEKLFSCRFEQVNGGGVNQLGLHKVLNQAINQVVEFELKHQKKKVYLHTDEYLVNGQRHKLIFITDIQRLLRDEERLAWQRLVRVLSHEINNSLTPIASISESLKLLTRDDLAETETQQDLTEGLAIISERAHSLNRFINSYHQLSTLPVPEKSMVNLYQFILSITSLYPEVTWHIQGDEKIELYIDSTQIQQVFVNLITNSIEASLPLHNKLNSDGKNQSDVQLADIKINIDWHVSNNKLQLNLIDEGSGIANTDNLFVPFYSTKKQGSGIGLVLSRQIIMNHDGDLLLQNRQDKTGGIASIYLPLNG